MDKGCGRKIGPYDCCAVVCGDCLELMKGLPDGCVDAVITDPPYGIGLDMVLRHGTTDGSIHGVADWNDSIPSDECFSEIYRISTEQIIWGCNYFGSNIRALGRIVHDKQLNIEGTALRYSEADIASCSTQKRVTIFRYRWNGNVQGNSINWENNGPDARFHPTQKPICLMAHCIEKCPKAATILDPFLGSGTTAVAAKKLGRHFLGFEISPEYCRIAEERIRLVEMKPTLFEKLPEQMEFVEGK